MWMRCSARKRGIPEPSWAPAQKPTRWYGYPVSASGVQVGDVQPLLEVGLTASPGGAWRSRSDDDVLVFSCQHARVLS